jgi:hypothetical protein
LKDNHAANEVDKLQTFGHKRAITDFAALAIIDQEAALEREKKTERLRALRLAQEDVLLAEAKGRKRSQ